MKSAASGTTPISRSAAQVCASSEQGLQLKPSPSGSQHDSAGSPVVPVVVAGAVVIGVGSVVTPAVVSGAGGGAPSVSWPPSSLLQPPKRVAASNAAV